MRKRPAVVWTGDEGPSRAPRATAVAELSYRELGEALDIDEAAARKRVSRAIAALRQSMDLAEEGRNQ